jgi:hypothetical protein
VVTEKTFLPTRHAAKPYCMSKIHTPSPSCHDGSAWPCTGALCPCICRHHRETSARAGMMSLGSATRMEGLKAATPRRLQIPPLRSCGAPDGMTRVERLRSGSSATRMDRIRDGYSAKTTPVRCSSKKVREKRPSYVQAFLLPACGSVMPGNVVAQCAGPWWQAASAGQWAG